MELRIVDTALMYLYDFVANFFFVVISPILDLLPYADLQNPIMSFFMYQNSSFNPACFFDWNILSFGVGILVTISMVCLIFSFIKFLLNVIHNLVDSIPIIG